MFGPKRVSRVENELSSAVPAAAAPSACDAAEGATGAGSMVGNGGATFLPQREGVQVQALEVHAQHGGVGPRGGQTRPLVKCLLLRVNSLEIIVGKSSRVSSAALDIYCCLAAAATAIVVVPSAARGTPRGVNPLLLFTGTAGRGEGTTATATRPAVIPPVVVWVGS